MPCTTYGIHNLIESTKEINISDFSDGMESCKEDKLTIKIKPLGDDNFRIIVGNDSQEFEEYSFDLLIEDKKENGLYQYRFIRNTDSPLFKKDIFPAAIYHKLKDYYHIHEVNKGNSADAYLQAFVNDNWEKTDLSADNNSALLFYLEQYEIIFKTYYIRIKKYYSIFKSKQTKKTDFKSRSTCMINIDNMFSSAKIEESYFNTLKNSINNKHFSSKNYILSEIKKRHTYLNTINYINKVSNIHNESHLLWEQNVTSKNVKYALIGTYVGILGVIAGIIGILTSL